MTIHEWKSVNWKIAERREWHGLASTNLNVPCHLRSPFPFAWFASRLWYCATTKAPIYCVDPSLDDSVKIVRVARNVLLLETANSFASLGLFSNFVHSALPVTSPDHDASFCGSLMQLLFLLQESWWSLAIGCVSSDLDAFSWPWSGPELQTLKSTKKKKKNTICIRSP